MDFKSNRGAPASVASTELESFTEYSGDGIQYFSGVATYRKQFELEVLPKSDRVVLDLGKVADIAEVLINGEPVGIVWKAPCELDVGAYLRQGAN